LKLLAVAVALRLVWAMVAVAVAAYKAWDRALQQQRAVLEERPVQLQPALLIMALAVLEVFWQSQHLQPQVQVPLAAVAAEPRPRQPLITPDQAAVVIMAVVAVVAAVAAPSQHVLFVLEAPEVSLALLPMVRPEVQAVVKPVRLAQTV
jgi:hypothetical protein